MLGLNEKKHQVPGDLLNMAITTVRGKLHAVQELFKQPFYVTTHSG
jgi:hypothetical protein